MVIPEERGARRVAMGQGNTARGTVVVRLPADAKLYAEGRPLTLTSAERSFVTPPLPVGPDYTYEFRAEYVRGGETISQAKRVAVKAGGSAEVEFTDLTLTKATATPKPIPLATSTPPAAPAPAELVGKGGKPTPQPAGDRARITVKLPPGATLYVDGKKNDQTTPVREFTTPPLPAGQEFAYLMKMELTRNGHPESVTTKVTFRAGEAVPVDFTTLVQK
jgi:uncharacterized protein (TIGR03000 family)